MPSHPKKTSRREFLVRGTQAAAGIVAAGTIASCAATKPGPAPKGRVIGANDRINIAVMGIRSRGRNHAVSFAKMPNVFVKTLCDVDENLFPERVKQIAGIQGEAPGTEVDIRRVLDDPDIDAITIASQNHWHALATIWACSSRLVSRTAPSST